MIPMTTGQRWVVLGLASPRTGWFTDVSRWSTTATIPVEFIKCVSSDEVRARLRSGRSYSALLIGSDLTTLDRDLVDTCRDAGAAVLVVGDRPRDWTDLGVSAVLADGFGPTELTSALVEFASPIARVEKTLPDETPEIETGWRGNLVAVTGPGGSGSSVAAMALAQELGSDASNRGLVVLADLALHADQAMLHDAREVVPGVQELVESHRGGRLAADQIRAMVFDVIDRGYHLLLGLRRHRDWTALRARAVDAAVQGLLRSYRVVVADVDPDIEGEAATGSLDVEDRNRLARAVILRADITVVVGFGDLKGLHSLARTVRDLMDGGVEPARIVIAVSRAARNPRKRAEVSSSVARVLNPVADSARLDNPVFIPDRRDLESALRDGRRLPGPLGRSLGAEVRRRLDQLDPLDFGEEASGPVRVAPGALGRWAEETG
jgi:cellulose biosynthesis protein BcsQ